MVVATRNWIVRQLTLGEFNSSSDVVRRSCRMALKIAAIAYAMNVLAHFALYGLGLMPYDLMPALVLATALTPPVSFIVAVIAYSVVGFAIHDLAVSRRELERLSRTDMLSGLLNRRAFQDAFDAASGDVTMILFDVDRFKSVNDTYGHKAGDDVIVAVANMLRSIYGDGHVCARIGGEEFAILSPLSADGDSLALAEAARLKIAGTPIAVASGSIQVTISGGIARSTVSRGFAEIFAAADSALYLAKAGGRNRIIRASDVESLVATQRSRSEHLSEPLPMQRRA